MDHAVTIKANGMAVRVVANDDSEAYDFVINGAVCASQAYDGIRIDSADPEFAERLMDLFTERAQRAVKAFTTQLGPIYV